MAKKKHPLGKVLLFTAAATSIATVAYLSYKATLEAYNSSTDDDFDNFEGDESDSKKTHSRKYVDLFKKNGNFVPLSKQFCETDDEDVPEESEEFFDEEEAPEEGSEEL